MLAKVGEEGGTYNLVKHYSSPKSKLEFAWPPRHGLARRGKRQHGHKGWWDPTTISSGPTSSTQKLKLMRTYEQFTYTSTLKFMKVLIISSYPLEENISLDEYV